MANEENLKKFTSEQSREEAVKNGKSGGIASGKSRRRKKHIKDTVKMLMQLPLTEGKLDQLTSYDTLNGKNRTVEEQLILKQIEKASKTPLRKKQGAETKNSVPCFNIYQ
ncbi:MAG: hypothetical protein IJU45_05380 [Clostridia bacterium]|nr:hypothetical protein [Clostridia bacterium]